MNQAVDYCLLFVGLVGWTVMGAWVFEWEPILYVVEGSVTMKSKTAAGFICAAASIFWLKREKLTLACMFALSLLFVMGWSMQTFLAEPAHLAKHSVAPGVASVATVLCFLGLAASMLTSVLMPERNGRPVKYAGMICLFAGTVALIGHLVGSPELTFEAPGRSTAMAIHTAICFMLLGSSMMYCSTLVNKQLQEDKNDGLEVA